MQSFITNKTCKCTQDFSQRDLLGLFPPKLILLHSFAWRHHKVSYCCSSESTQILLSGASCCWDVVCENWEELPSRLTGKGALNHECRSRIVWASLPHLWCFHRVFVLLTCPVWGFWVGPDDLQSSFQPHSVTAELLYIVFPICCGTGVLQVGPQFHTAARPWIVCLRWVLLEQNWHFRAPF